MTDREAQAIEILVAHEGATDRFGEPIYTLDRVIGGSSQENRTLVEDLERRGLVIVYEKEDRSLSPTGKSRWGWKRGEVSS